MFDKILGNKHFIRNREVLLFAMDISLVLIAYAVSFLVRYNFNLETILNDKNTYYLILISLVVYGGSFVAFKIHKSLWRYIGIKEIFSIGISVMISAFVMLCVNTYFIKDIEFNSVITFATLLALFSICIIRLFYRMLRNYEANSDKEQVRTLIVGAGDGGYVLMKDIINNRNINVNIVGFIDDLKVNKTISGFNILGTTKDIPALVEKHNVKRVYIAMPSATKKEIERILDICQTCEDLETKILKRQIVSESLSGQNNMSIEDISIEDLLGRGEVHLDQHEIASYITDEAVLVTGAGGSIGSELCRQILQFKPKTLYMLDVNENGLYMLEQEFNRNRVHNIIDGNIEIVSLVASIRDEKALNNMFAKLKPNVVFHAAAHKHVPLMETRPMEAIKNNVFGTHNVIKACIKNKVSRFIMISTDKAVNPTNVMGASKRMTEMILQSYGDNGKTKIAAVRFGNVLGSNGSVIPIFKEQIKEGGPITITSKEITRYFMTIPEAAQLVLQAGYYADKGEIFVLDMGEPIKILSLAEKLIRLSGYKPYEDIEIKEIGLRPGEKMYEELHLKMEKCHKTKNDLIFVNETIPISKAEITAKLEILSNLISKSSTNEKIRSTILEVISDSKEEGKKKNESKI